MGRLRVAALAALVVVDVVLVGLAVRHVGEPATTAAHQPVTSGARASAAENGGSRPATSGTTRERGNGGAGRTVAVDDPAARLLLNVAPSGAIIRARPGACGAGGGAVWLSTDGGASFTRSRLDRDAAVVVRVSALDDAHARVYAADRECRSYALWTTADGGQSWRRSGGTAGSWHLLGIGGGRVQSPAGRVALPCAGERPSTGPDSGDDETVESLSILSGRSAYALCSGGALLRTVDAGADWERRAEIPGARAADFASTEHGVVALVGGGTCAGVTVLHTGDAGRSWDRVDCLRGARGSSVGIAMSGDQAYLRAGERGWASSDGGRTWVRR